MDLAVPVDVGRGAPIVILPGFAMSPSVYRPTAELLARRARVVVPDIYRLRGGWSCDDVVAGLRAMLDARDAMSSVLDTLTLAALIANDNAEDLAEPLRRYSMSS